MAAAYPYRAGVCNIGPEEVRRRVRVESAEDRALDRRRAARSIVVALALAAGATLVAVVG
jgi:hypothetical protein